MGRKFGNSKLEKFKQIFTNKRNNLIESIQKNSNQEIDFDGDETDVVQGNILNDINSKLSKRDINLLERIDKSLQKIQEGTFGTCEECDERIGEKRLTAIPGCELCIDCAEEQEREAKLFLSGNI